MGRKVMLDEIIPAKHGKAFEVMKGQTLRIYLVEDKQVGDIAFFNLHDFKEWFHVSQTWSLNNALGTGTAKSFKHFYSRPPRVNLMLTVLEDTVKNHSGNISTRCNPKYCDLMGRSYDRTCDDNLTEALEPYGMTSDDAPDVFNVFLASELTTDGRYIRHAPTAMKGDYIDMRAEMDILAAISACPDQTIVNDYRPKPLGVKILE